MFTYMPQNATRFCSFVPVWLHQTRIGLSLYDVAGQGYLRESVSISITPANKQEQSNSHKKRWIKSKNL